MQKSHHLTSHSHYGSVRSVNSPLRPHNYTRRQRPTEDQGVSHRVPEETTNVSWRLRRGRCLIGGRSVRRRQKIVVPAGQHLHRGPASRPAGRCQFRWRMAPISRETPSVTSRWRHRLPRRRRSSSSEHNDYWLTAAARRSTFLIIGRCVRRQQLTRARGFIADENVC